MRLVKEGKAKTSGTGLRRWRDEKWRNLTPISLGDNRFYECGEQSAEQRKMGLPSVCRPSKRISSKTTKPLAKDISPAELKKAIAIKKRGGTIAWSKL